MCFTPSPNEVNSAWWTVLKRRALDLTTSLWEMNRCNLFKGPNISQKRAGGREENAGREEKGQKLSKTCAGNCSIKKPNQYYPESLVIKFNGLLSLRSLQQHRKKCLFPLTSHLYCWMLALLSLSLLPPPCFRQYIWFECNYKADC